jgi:hypothetical protein
MLQLLVLEGLKLFCTKVLFIKPNFTPSMTTLEVEAIIICLMNNEPLQTKKKFIGNMG